MQRTPDQTRHHYRHHCDLTALLYYCSQLITKSTTNRPTLNPQRSIVPPQQQHQVRHPISGVIPSQEQRCLQVQIGCLSSSADEPRIYNGCFNSRCAIYLNQSSVVSLQALICSRGGLTSLLCLLMYMLLDDLRRNQTIIPTSIYTVS